MPRAWNLLRRAVWYRHEAFSAGLRACGYDVLTDTPERGAPGEVLLIWNRYGGLHELASRFERGGGTVLVAENGYLGHGGSEPKFDVHPGGPKPHHYYSVAIGWHNGRGRWKHVGPERFKALGVELKDWRTAGDHVLVCSNRSFGVPPQVMPEDWAERTAAWLKHVTSRRVVVRKHPGNDRPTRPLSADLANAWAMVIWSSGAGVHALAAGIPVFCEAPFWILKNAAAHGSIDAPVLPERLTVEANFDLLASAQWRMDEIESGEPFRHLLRAGVEAEVG